MENENTQSMQTAEEQAKENPVLDRIRHLMKISHLTQAALAQRIGIDASNVSKYMTGRLPISNAFINRVIVNMGVSKEWIREGRGIPYEKGAPEGVSCEPYPVIVDPAESGIPVYDIEVAAGLTSNDRAVTSENVLGRIKFPNMNPRWAVVRAEGDSMQPVIQNGGYVVFMPENDLDNIMWGQIYIVITETRRMVKYVRRHQDADMVVLRSANPDYDDMDMKREDIVALYPVKTILNMHVLL